jgi:hypothetical protein
MPRLMLVVFSLCLLSIQVSGLHLHVGPEGNGGLHGTHIHEADPDAHDHEGDSDVSLVELGTGSGKLLVFLLPFAFILLAVVECGKCIRTPVVGSMRPRRRSRWRPPLRAPPSLSF